MSNHVVVMHSCSLYIVFLSGRPLHCFFKWPSFILCYLPLQFPLELDPWELLQKHVLSDYANNEVPMYSMIISPFGTIDI